jgi:signal peptidase II
VAESNRRQCSDSPTAGPTFLSQIAKKNLPPAKAHLVFWAIAVLGTVLDLWTKSAVFGWLRHRASFSIIEGFLNFELALNAGAAFGIATGQRYLLISVSAIALLVTIVVFLLSSTEHKLMPVILGLFAAGVSGNLYDRMFNQGLVRDFIDVVYWPGRHWPAFNLADSMLCGAVGLLLISSLFTAKSSQKRARPQK